MYNTALISRMIINKIPVPGVQYFPKLMVREVPEVPKTRSVMSLLLSARRTGCAFVGERNEVSTKLLPCQPSFIMPQGAGEKSH